MVAEKFQIYSVKTTANTFASQNIQSVQFYSCPQAKSPLGFYHYPPSRRELPIPPEQHFLKLFFPEEKEGGEDCVVEKINKGILINSTIFATFSFGLCFAVQ